MGRKPSYDKALPLVLTPHYVDIEKLFKKHKLGKRGVLRVLVMPDTHYPDHDPEAVNAFLKFGKEYKPHAFVHIGDFFEMEYVSPHEPGKARVDAAVEHIENGKRYMSKIVKTLGAKDLFFCVGNHEIWWERYHERKNPGWERVAQTCRKFQAVSDYHLDFNEDFTVIPHNQLLQIGHMCFTHGFYTSQYHAAKHLSVVGSNVMYGHLESTQQHTNISASGIKTAQCIGTMRSIKKARFMRNRPCDWIHAFGIIEFRRDGMFTYYVPHIIDGQFTFNGKLYKGGK